MPRAYSLDLRERVNAHVEAGSSCHDAARRFGVSASFVVKLMAAYRATGSLAPKLAPHEALLLARVAEKEDITMPELDCELAERGLTVAPSSISRWFIRKGYRFKKNAVGQRTRSSRHPSGAPGMDHPAPAEDAA